ncbi:MAG TPA: class I SAM-dependent methyltransferase [Candidatus Omnitrophota bacterium]|nr:class I SAM-dependent methyltransferase [Candidatus Omnitrophota bacterium]
MHFSIINMALGFCLMLVPTIFMLFDYAERAIARWTGVLPPAHGPPADATQPPLPVPPAEGPSASATGRGTAQTPPPSAQSLGVDREARTSQIMAVMERLETEPVGENLPEDLIQDILAVYPEIREMPSRKLPHVLRVYRYYNRLLQGDIQYFYDHLSDAEKQKMEAVPSFYYPHLSPEEINAYRVQGKTGKEIYLEELRKISDQLRALPDAERRLTTLAVFYHDHGYTKTTDADAYVHNEIGEQYLPGYLRETTTFDEATIRQLARYNRLHTQYGQMMVGEVTPWPIVNATPLERFQLRVINVADLAGYSADSNFFDLASAVMTHQFEDPAILGRFAGGKQWYDFRLSRLARSGFGPDLPQDKFEAALRAIRAVVPAAEWNDHVAEWNDRLANVREFPMFHKTADDENYERFAKFYKLVAQINKLLRERNGLETADIDSTYRINWKIKPGNPEDFRNFFGPWRAALDSLPADMTIDEVRRELDASGWTWVKGVPIRLGPERDRFYIDFPKILPAQASSLGKEEYSQALQDLYRSFAVMQEQDLVPLEVRGDRDESLQEVVRDDGGRVVEVRVRNQAGLMETVLERNSSGVLARKIVSNVFGQNVPAETKVVYMLPDAILAEIDSLYPEIQSRMTQVSPHKVGHQYQVFLCLNRFLNKDWSYFRKRLAIPAGMTEPLTDEQTMVYDSVFDHMRFRYSMELTDEDKENLFYAVLFHDYGYAIVNHPQMHPAVGSDEIVPVLRERTNFSEERIQKIAALVRLHAHYGQMMIGEVTPDVLLSLDRTQRFQLRILSMVDLAGYVPYAPAVAQVMAGATNYYDFNAMELLGDFEMVYALRRFVEQMGWEDFRLTRLGRPRFGPHMSEEDKFALRSRLAEIVPESERLLFDMEWNNFIGMILANQLFMRTSASDHPAFVRFAKLAKLTAQLSFLARNRIAQNRQIDPDSIRTEIGTTLNLWNPTDREKEVNNAVFVIWTELLDRLPAEMTIEEVKGELEASGWTKVGGISLRFNPETFEIDFDLAAIAEDEGLEVPKPVEVTPPPPSRAPPPAGAGVLEPSMQAGVPLPGEAVPAAPRDLSFNDLFAFVIQEFERVFGLNGETPEGRAEFVRIASVMLRDPSQFSHDRGVITFEGKPYKLQNTSLIPYLLGLSEPFATFYELRQRAKLLGEETRVRLGGIAREIFVEGAKEKGQFLSPLFEPFSRKIVALLNIPPENIVAESFERKLPSEEEIAANNRKRLDRIRTRHPGYSVELIQSLLFPLLDEARRKPETPDSELFAAIERQAAQDPGLVMDLLAEYFDEIIGDVFDTKDPLLREVYYDDPADKETFIFHNKELMDWMCLLPTDWDLFLQSALARVDQYLKANPGKQVTILELASGSGRLSIELAKRFGDRISKIVITDYDPDVLSGLYYRVLENGDPSKMIVEPADAGDLRAFGDGAFDVVVSMGGLRYYFYTVGRLAAKEVMRVVKNDGMVVIGDPMNPGHERMQEEFMGYLAQNGARGTVLENSSPEMFRLMAFYIYRHNYLHHQERPYNQLFRNLVDGSRRQGVPYLDILGTLAGVRNKTLLTITASPDEGVIDRMEAVRGIETAQSLGGDFLLPVMAGVLSAGILPVWKYHRVKTNARKLEEIFEHHGVDLGEKDLYGKLSKVAAVLKPYDAFGRLTGALEFIVRNNLFGYGNQLMSPNEIDALLSSGNFPALKALRNPERKLLYKILMDLDILPDQTPSIWRGIDWMNRQLVRALANPGREDFDEFLLRVSAENYELVRDAVQKARASDITGTPGEREAAAKEAAAAGKLFAAGSPVRLFVPLNPDDEKPWEVSHPGVPTSLPALGSLSACLDTLRTQLLNDPDIDSKNAAVYLMASYGTRLDPIASTAGFGNKAFLFFDQLIKQRFLFFDSGEKGVVFLSQDAVKAPMRAWRMLGAPFGIAMYADERVYDDPTLLPLGNLLVERSQDSREISGIVTPDRIIRAVEKPRSLGEIEDFFVSFGQKMWKGLTGRKPTLLANQADYRLTWPAARALVEEFGAPASNGEPLFYAYALNWVEHLFEAATLPEEIFYERSAKDGFGRPIPMEDRVRIRNAALRVSEKYPLGAFNLGAGSIYAHTNTMLQFLTEIIGELRSNPALRKIYGVEMDSKGRIISKDAVIENPDDVLPGAIILNLPFGSPTIIRKGSRVEGIVTGSCGRLDIPKDAAAIEVHEFDGERTVSARPGELVTDYWLRRPGEEPQALKVRLRFPVFEEVKRPVGDKTLYDAKVWPRDPVSSYDRDGGRPNAVTADEERADRWSLSELRQALDYDAMQKMREELERLAEKIRGASDGKRGQTLERGMADLKERFGGVKTVEGASLGAKEKAEEKIAPEVPADMAGRMERALEGIGIGRLETRLSAVADAKALQSLDVLDEVLYRSVAGTEPAKVSTLLIDYGSGLIDLSRLGDETYLYSMLSRADGQEVVIGGIDADADLDALTAGIPSVYRKRVRLSHEDILTLSHRYAESEYADRNIVVLHSIPGRDGIFAKLGERFFEVRYDSRDETLARDERLKTLAVRVIGANLALYGADAMKIFRQQEDLNVKMSDMRFLDLNLLSLKQILDSLLEEKQNAEAVSRAA